MTLTELPIFHRPAAAVPGRPPAGPPAGAGAAAPPAHDPGVDWNLVRAFRQQAAEQLAAQLRDAPMLDPSAQRALGAEIVRDLLRVHVEADARAGRLGLPPAVQQALHRAVLDSLFGLGRLQPLVDDPDLENIEIYGAARVVLQYADGRLVEGPPVAESDAELIDAVAFLAARQQGNERAFSPASPLLHLRLDGGARLAAAAWVTPVPVVVIRLHRLRSVTLADLAARGTLTPESAAFLAAAVRANKSIVVAGPMGAGKTTLVRALCAEFDPYEAVATVETEYELHLHELADRHRRVHAFEARPGGGELLADGRSSGEVTLDDLVRTVWRHNVTRIVVGEVRGPEVLTMLNVMSGGAGSLCTVHADSARAAVDRLVTLAMGAGPHVSAEFARRQVAEHIDIIVHLAVQPSSDGSAPSRYVREVVGLEHTGDGPAITDLWRAAPGSTAVQPGHIPAHLAAELGWCR